MNRQEWAFEACTLMLFSLVVFLLFVLAIFMPVNAQDAPSVCRDTTVETPRFLFHNLPAGWSDGSVVWWALYEGGSFENGVLVADAYTENEDADLIGTATVGSEDFTLELRGDASTPDCEAIVPTPEVTPEPVMQQPMVQIVRSTGRMCTIKYPEIILVCQP